MDGTSKLDLAFCFCVHGQTPWWFGGPHDLCITHWDPGSPTGNWDVCSGTDGWVAFTVWIRQVEEKSPVMSMMETNMQHFIKSPREVCNRKEYIHMNFFFCMSMYLCCIYPNCRMDTFLCFVFFFFPITTYFLRSFLIGGYKAVSLFKKWLYSTLLYGR